MFNKSILALAAVAVSGSASAQSSVTLWGVVDATVAYGSGSVAKRTQLSNSGLTSSQLGFRGFEDLGSDLKAGFWLEAGVNNDSGTGQASSTNNQLSGVNSSGGLMFNRRSTASVGGAWGEVRLGRDYSPQFWNLTFFDPFGTIGVGGNQMLASSVSAAPTSLAGPTVRASNSISYAWNHGFNALLAPGNEGLHVLVQHYLGENLSNAANSNDGTGTGVRVGYNAGPLNAAIAVSRTSFATGGVRQNNVAGGYNFGVARLTLQVSSDRSGAVKGEGYLLGMTTSVGVGLIRASYSHYKSDAAGSPATGKIALGYVHNLSKRTALYGTLAHASNKGAAAVGLNAAATAPGRTSSGMDLGIRHVF